MPRPAVRCFLPQRRRADRRPLLPAGFSLHKAWTEWTNLNSITGANSALRRAGRPGTCGIREVSLRSMVDPVGQSTKKTSGMDFTLQNAARLPGTLLIPSSAESIPVGSAPQPSAPRVRSHGTRQHTPGQHAATFVLSGTTFVWLLFSSLSSSFQVCPRAKNLDFFYLVDKHDGMND